MSLFFSADGKSLHTDGAHGVECMVWSDFGHWYWVIDWELRITINKVKRWQAGQHKKY